MLASLTDHIFAVIESDHIAVMHTRMGLFRRKIVAEKKSPLTLSTHRSNDNQHIVSTMSALLSQLSIQGGKLEIILVDSLAHIEILPALEQALKTGEQLKRVQLHFQKKFGTVADQWSFSFCPAGFQQPVMAAAIDRTLLSDLRQMAATLNFKLVAVEPVLMCILRYWENRLTPQPLWLVVTRATSCSILRIELDCLTTVLQILCRKAFSGDEIRAHLTREALRLGESLQDKALYLFSTEKLGQSLEMQGTRLQQLHLPATNNGDDFSDLRLLKMLVSG